MSDGSRVLSPLGREVARQVGMALSEANENTELIVSSPLVRAVQTAEIIAGCFPAAPDVVVQEGLGTEGSTGGILRLLPQYIRYERIMLVGHEPTMGILAATVTGRDQKIAFLPAAVCCVDGEFGKGEFRGSFRWMLSPFHDGHSSAVTLQRYDRIEPAG